MSRLRDVCVCLREERKQNTNRDPPHGSGLTREGASIKTAVSDTFALIEFCYIPTDPSILFV